MQLEEIARSAPDARERAAVWCCGLLRWSSKKVLGSTFRELAGALKPLGHGESLAALAAWWKDSGLGRDDLAFRSLSPSKKKANKPLERTWVFKFVKDIVKGLYGRVFGGIVLLRYLGSKVVLKFGRGSRNLSPKVLSRWDRVVRVLADPPWAQEESPDLSWLT